MPFNGNHPFGTAGGDDDLLLPQDPPDAVMQEGGSHLAYLIINGPITIRNRSAIEAIVRTLDNRGRAPNGGLPIVALITKFNGALIEGDTGEIDARNGIKVTSVTPNVVTIELANGGIQTAKLANAIVSAAKLATDAVETTKIKNLNVTGAKLANRTITAGKIGQNQVTPYELDRTYSTPGHSHSGRNGTFTLTHKKTSGGTTTLRTQPGYDAYVIASVPTGTEVALISSGSISSGGDSWYQVYMKNGGIGWLPWLGMSSI